MKRTSHVEIADEQWLHSEEVNQIWDNNEIEIGNNKRRQLKVT
jgi:hypothetical protein